MMKPLIIAADDYAQSAAIDAGILNLIKLGRVTAASCLTLSPRWGLASHLITAEIRQRADIGLHLDFTQYVQPAKHRLSHLIIKSHGRLLNNHVIRQSIRAQLTAFEDAMGTAPDYIDGHQHVHQLPQIRSQLIAELQARYATNMPWIRIANPPYRDGIKALLIRKLGAHRLATLADQHGILHTRDLLGVYAFNMSSEAYTQKLNDWFDYPHSSQIDCLMCHPAQHIDCPENAIDPIFAARLHEYEALAQRSLASTLQAKQLKLVRGSSALKQND